MRSFSAFLVFFVIGFLMIVYYKQYLLSQIQQSITTPISKAIPFSLAVPPPHSLKGKIVRFSSADVQWQKRDATEPADLRTYTQVVQADEFWTGEHGNLVIEFPKGLSFDLFPNTHITYVQTLPESFVVNQDAGKIRYTNRGAQKLSIRMSPLLIQQNSGELTIEKDDKLSQITLTVPKGLVNVAFNDSENTSTIITIDEGNTYTFDIPTRTGEITSL